MTSIHSRSTSSLSSSTARIATGGMPRLAPRPKAPPPFAEYVPSPLVASVPGQRLPQAPTRAVRDRLAPNRAFGRLRLGPLYGPRTPIEHLAEAIALGLSDEVRVTKVIDQAIADMASPGGFALLDTRWLFPKALVREAHRQFFDDLETGARFSLDLDTRAYRGLPQIKEDFPTHLDVFRDYVDFVERISRRVLEHDIPKAKGRLSEVTVRASNDRPLWATQPHAHKEYLTSTVTLLGPGTEYDPSGGSMRGDRSGVIQAPVGTTLLFGGEARTRVTEHPPLVHNAPASEGPRLMLAMFFERRSDAAPPGDGDQSLAARDPGMHAR